MKTSLVVLCCLLLSFVIQSAPVPLPEKDGSPPAKKQPTRILLRSSWQTVNIGDIAHTPGMLALLEKHRPDAEITLWPSSVDRGVEEILRARFPKLKIAKS